MALKKHEEDISGDVLSEDVRAVIDYFRRSEGVLESIGSDFRHENASEDLLEEIYERRERLLGKVNETEADTLVDVSKRLGLWVLQNYPNKGDEPESLADELVLTCYFQLTGLIGIEPVREE